MRHPSIMAHYRLQPRAGLGFGAGTQTWAVDLRTEPWGYVHPAPWRLLV